MIEVEIRAKINDVNKIKKILNKIGAKFIKREKQIDRIFGHPMFLDSETKIIEGGFSARIRETNNKKLLEFKEILRQKSGIEIKSELSDVDEGLKFLKKLQWKEAFTIKKLRDSYSYNGFTICLDNVNQLGNFIEIEKIITSGDKAKIKEECLNLLTTLAPNSKIENRKYDDLMQDIINKKIKNKKKKCFS